jgi:DNA repair exonuclease SbcCD ATPase subunit
MNTPPDPPRSHEPAAGGSTQPDAVPEPPDGAPDKSRNWWIWASAGLGLLAACVLVWALTLRSDVDSAQAESHTANQALASTNQQLETTEAELESTKQELDTKTQQLDDATQTAAAPPEAPEEEQGRGGTALVAAGALVTGLARELGATQQDVAATEQELTEAENQADDAEQEAAAAKRLADDATDDAEKADAQVNQANAERDAAQAKARIAAECGKAYLSAFGELFGSGNLREQVPAVRKDLEGITADCKAAFAGT